MTTKVYISGVCRICGCTDLSPCILAAGLTFDEERNPSALAACSWLDPAHTVCSNLDCVARIPLNELIEICFPAPKARAVAS